MTTHQTTISLTSQSLQMFVTDALSVNQNVRHELTEKPTPGIRGQFRLRAKLAELTHHRGLANQRRIQSANNLQKKFVRVLAAIYFTACGCCRQVRTEISASEKLNLAKTRPPL